MNTFHEELDALSSAEDFLEYFEVDYDPHVVHVNRLHILQRFHDYLKAAVLPAEAQQQRAAYRMELSRAYGDFVHSDARTQRAIGIYKRQGPQTVCVPLERIGGRRKGA